MTKSKELKYDNVVPLKTEYAYDIKCQDNLKYMRLLPDESMHLIVTSPPYNIGKEYEKRTTLERYIEEQVSTIAEAVISARHGPILKVQGSWAEATKPDRLDLRSRASLPEPVLRSPRNDPVVHEIRRLYFQPGSRARPIEVPEQEALQGPQQRQGFQPSARQESGGRLGHSEREGQSCRED